MGAPASAPARSPAWRRDNSSSWRPEVATYLRDALTPQRFEDMTRALSTPPLTTCVRVNTLRASVPEVMAHLTGSSPQQPAAPFVHPAVPMAVMLPGQGPLPVDLSLAGAPRVRSRGDVATSDASAPACLSALTGPCHSSQGAARWW